MTKNSFLSRQFWAQVNFKECLILLIFVILLGFFFANVEIQIEGASGWATSLPTWRIEKHWLLTLFWGGRAMTGYHAWMFSFIALIFHLPIFLNGGWSMRIQIRIIAAIMLFWVSEDFLWFVLNPAYGLAHFNPVSVTWHPHWLLGVPVDYWFGSILGVALMLGSYNNKTAQSDASFD